MLQPGSLAMKREDAMQLLGDLGEVQGRLDRNCDGLRALLSGGGPLARAGSARGTKPGQHARGVN
jgi:hypothetical protein